MHEDVHPDLVRHRRTLAAAQTIPSPGDVAANVEQHLRLATIAADARAQVLVYPELSLTGYEMALADSLAFSENDPRLDPLRDAAARSSMTIVAGAPVRTPSGLHIGAFILTPDRDVALYTKHHLGVISESARVDGIVPPPEASVFTPGTRNPLVNLGGTAAAVAICADTGRPAHAQAAAARGAATYLASVFIIPSCADDEIGNLATYSERHAMAVVMANYGGPSGGLASAGRSAIWSERGERVAELAPAGAGVAIAAETDAGWRGRAIMLGD